MLRKLINQTWQVANASLDKKQVIGRISIPSVSLELPVLKSSTEKTYYQVQQQ